MSFAELVNLIQSVLFIKMKLSAWYPLLQPYTAQTILVDLSLPAKQRNELIEKAIATLGPVFVRVDELSPKHFQPCSTVQQVWSCLKVSRTKDCLQWSRYLCLRKWVDFNELLEVRCFINNGITAISQNDAQKDSEVLIGFLNPAARNNDAEENDPYLIKAAILKYVRHFLHLLPPQCTVDLAFDRNLKFQVVEVNSSFLEHAGAGLFDLENPSDHYQLERGHANPRFRYYVNLWYGQEEC
jgi:hypothetical protein